MKKFFAFALTVSTFIAISQEVFAYYTVEQIKYEQSLSKYDTQNKVMEKPRTYQQMHQNYYDKQRDNNRSYYNDSSYTRERPMHRFGSSSKL